MNSVPSPSSGRTRRPTAAVAGVSTLALAVAFSFASPSKPGPAARAVASTLLAVSKSSLPRPALGARMSPMIQACAAGAGKPSAGIPTGAALDPLTAGAPLTFPERIVLCQIAAQTWKFFAADVNPVTDLPLDNIGFNGAPAQGAYTSPTDIAMELWSTVAAANLHLISYGMAQQMARHQLAAIARLERWNGFLLSWYDTTTGQAITAPGGAPVTKLRGQFISTVDNGWYASALIVDRQAFPSLYPQATSLLDAMQFHIFYDNGNQATNISAGQMYGGYYIGQGPASFEYGNLNTDPRIAAYVGMGLGQLPGDVWWRTWRTLPASFSWQTQSPVGPTVSYPDPYSGTTFPVVEGHYSYRGITYVPSWGGSAFEALMAPLVVPETSWGKHSFGLNDVNYTEASIAYARQGLGYRVWGLSPASTPGTSGGYQAYGAIPLSSNAGCCPYSRAAVAPYASFAALPEAPQQAFRNIERLARDYPALVGPYGLYDSVNPTTGVVAPRYLVLDEGMILAGIDDALAAGGLQRYFGADPVGQHVRPYLAMERFSITPAPGVGLSASSPRGPAPVARSTAPEPSS
ncbi:MAG: glucoamylase family protein [Candidatus Dormibacteria bacterium]